MPEEKTDPSSATKQSLSLAPEVTVARRVRPTRTLPRHSPPHGINRNDILFALFKHKKKIVLGAALGMLGAAVVFFEWPAQYESDAKLLVRYLVERTTVDNVDATRGSGNYASSNDTIIQAELEILSSWDLAVQTAEAIGPKRLLPNYKGAVSKEAAAATIASGLTLRTEKGSNILFVSYKNQNPELTTVVLNELVNRYFNKHLEVHRSAGAFDFVTQQTDQVRARLNQTEDALKDVKQKAGIVSLNDSVAALSAEATRTEDQVHAAEAELAEQQARLRQMGGSVAEKSGSGGPSKPEAPAEVVQQYQVLVSRLPQLRSAKMDLLARYTPSNRMVKANQ